MPPRKKKTQKKKVKKAAKAKKTAKSKKIKKPEKGKKPKKTALARKTIKKKKPKTAKKPKKTRKLSKAKTAKKAGKAKKISRVKKPKAAKKGGKTSTKSKSKVLKKNFLKTKQSEQYQKALKEFGRAVNEFNRLGFTEAKERLLEIIKKYPQEQELSENARTYIKICDKHLERRSPRPKELDDFYNHGVLHLNNENFKEAIKFFDKAISFDSKSEKVLYAKATALALNGNKDEAVSSLKTAIKYEPQNRIRAKSDPDFDSLRTDSEFNELIDPSEEIE
jgi:tetratricopeptide (TPR) repeat protein